MDSTEFKLETAEKFLAKIPSQVPKTPRELEKLEENAEAFLFFASGVIEAVKRQINDKFEIFDKQNVFYMHGLRKNLANSGSQKKVKDAITTYFTTLKTKPRVDTTKSSLWRLQMLRNQAMHGNIIFMQGCSLVFRYTAREGNTMHQFVQKTQDPRRYFERILVSLKRFRAQVNQILAQS
ncbi:MAG: hypothetical protein ACKO7Y_06160 [Candidatus Nitrosotenuis sp.]